MSRQPRIVRHRWNLPEGQEPPQPNDTIRGASRAHSWRVVELLPVESRAHPNAWIGRLQKLGPWETGDYFDWAYSSARERAQQDTQ